MKKIDIHCHVTSKNLRVDLINLTDKAKEHNIEMIFLMSTYFPKKKNGVSNYRLYNNIKSDNLFKMYLSLDFNYFWMAYNEMVEILQEDRDKVVGIKIYTGYQEINIDSKEMYLIMALAHEYNLPVVFHTGYTKGAGRASAFSPMELVNLMSNFHYINFVIAHLGNPDISTTIKIINTLNNVWTDISGLMEDNINFDENDRVNVYEVYKNIPIEKLLYGTDYPVQTYEQTNKLLKNIPEEDVMKIMYTNAKGLFNV